MQLNILLWRGAVVQVWSIPMAQAAVEPVATELFQAVFLRERDTAYPLAQAVLLEPMAQTQLSTQPRL
jgi:hypothetical protein